jgi:hypothetical protein
MAIPPDLESCYRVLDVDHNASAKEIQSAYRMLAKVWHPDRFVHDEPLRAKAQEKLQSINRAFEAIKGAPLRQQEQRTPNRPAEPPPRNPSSQAEPRSARRPDSQAQTRPPKQAPSAGGSGAPQPSPPSERGWLIGLSVVPLAFAGFIMATGGFQSVPEQDRVAVFLFLAFVAGCPATLYGVAAILRYSRRGSRATRGPTQTHYRTGPSVGQTKANPGASVPPRQPVGAPPGKTSQAGTTAPDPTAKSSQNEQRKPVEPGTPPQSGASQPPTIVLKDYQTEQQKPVQTGPPIAPTLKEVLKQVGEKDQLFFSLPGLGRIRLH